LTVIEQQQLRIAALEAELDKLRQPPPNSTNSSQPPSRDQKADRPRKKRRKHGPPCGHAKYSRPLAENPDRVLTAPLTHCRQCRADLSGLEPEQIRRRQITELPQAKPIVIESRQHCLTCPHCQTPNQGLLPEGLEAERYFGPNPEATVVFYKQTQHLSCERIVQTMRDLHGVTLSEGAVSSILKRAGRQAAPVAEAIKQQVITGRVTRSDETRARVEARNWWQWVFLSEHGVYHDRPDPQRR